MTTPEREQNGSAQLSETIDEVTKDNLRTKAHDDADEAERRYRDQLWVAHAEVHAALAKEVETAFASVERERIVHNASHEREHAAHQRIHDDDKSAVDVALAAVGRERDLHAAAHEREHAMQNQALDKAEKATETRFAGVNEFREQLRDQAARLATQERVSTLEKDVNRRFDEMRLSITNLEKGDVKAEGKGIGQGAVIAAIVTAISVAGALLGLIIVIANLITARGA